MSKRRERQIWIRLIVKADELHRPSEEPAVCVDALLPNLMSQPRCLAVRCKCARERQTISNPERRCVDGTRLSQATAMRRRPPSPASGTGSMRGGAGARYDSLALAASSLPPDAADGSRSPDRIKNCRRGQSSSEAVAQDATRLRGGDKLNDHSPPERAGRHPDREAQRPGS